MKKSFCILFSILFIISTLNCNVLASETTPNNYELTVEELKEASKELETMTVDELNDYIDRIANTYYAENGSRSGSVPTGNLQLAWIAVADIAAKEGYTCSAALVKSSVYNTAYTEKIDISGSKGLFQKNKYGIKL